jgi:regulator of protease activity HflC (stomatin/prohibitin superfamily)
VAFTSYFVVDQKELSAVFRFGRFNRMAEPGLHFKLPFGFERNYNVPAQVVLKEEFGFRTEVPGITSIRSSRDYPGESIMLTGDFWDNVNKFPTKILSWDGESQRIPTEENQFIWVDTTARWKITNPKLSQAFMDA